jgi:hypothetical protein
MTELRDSAMKDESKTETLEKAHALVALLGSGWRIQLQERLLGPHEYSAHLKKLPHVTAVVAPYGLEEGVYEIKLTSGPNSIVARSKDPTTLLPSVMKELERQLYSLQSACAALREVIGPSK